ncbi:hypothetical protein [Mycolicibacterium frederiksbergense]|uniref:hypothetical protein n=1 Tax=Mycolicibacterium frederiksbergense TaxID=117567 RepID=UPI00265C1876|nr:hypothetical protein [Mycolicibacterium frederiksbergense]MDO0977418.1 hypothetical protein [Mycolicibacterium frederiksbergense]
MLRRPNLIMARVDVAQQWKLCDPTREIDHPQLHSGKELIVQNDDAVPIPKQLRLLLDGPGQLIVALRKTIDIKHDSPIIDPVWHLGATEVPVLRWHR